MGGLNAAIPLLGATSSAASTGATSDEITAAFRFEDIVTATKRYVPVVTEGLGLSATQGILRGVVLRERLGLALAQVTNSHRQAIIAEALRFHETLLAGRAATITEGLGLGIVDQVQRAVTIVERLGLLEVVAGAALYHRTVSEALRLHDTLGRFLGVDVAEGLGLSGALVGTMSFDQTLSEGLGLAAVVAPRMLLRATVEDSLALDDVSILNMIFAGTIAESLELTIGYLAPNGSFSTWAMNTRSGAVTEYSNYEFNSFARIGNTYLGASDSGLHELLGDDDDGTDIVAEIRSGFAQWAGSKLMSFKGAYLGVRGGGEFVLKLITPDDQTFIYAVNAKDMATTKVTLGKGLRARYWAFELISTGQDFDLETIEFVPLVAGRRV